MARKGSKSKIDIDTSGHHLVPLHEVLSADESARILEELGVSRANFPKIFSDDQTIRRQDPEAGDIIRITRSSPTAGKLIVYRVVVER